MVRKTVGQAVTAFLDRQYVMRDGKKIKFVEGIFTIFGHGNVCGLGEALAADSGRNIIGIPRRFNRDGARTAKSIVQRQLPLPLHTLQQNSRQRFPHRRGASA